MNEKVYTVSLLSIALVAWLAVRWADDAPGPRRDRWLLAAIYVLALTSTNHTMGVLGAPILGVYVLLTAWRTLIRPKFLALAAAVAVIGVSPNYVYLPLRAAQLPAINEGEPTGFFSKALMETLNRTQYLKPGVLPRQPWAPGDVVDNAGPLSLRSSTCTGTTGTGSGERILAGSVPVEHRPLLCHRPRLACSASCAAIAERASPPHRWRSR